MNIYMTVAGVFLIALSLWMFYNQGRIMSFFERYKYHRRL